MTSCRIFWTTNTRPTSQTLCGYHRAPVCNRCSHVQLRNKLTECASLLQLRVGSVRCPVRTVPGAMLMTMSNSQFKRATTRTRKLHSAFAFQLVITQLPT